MTFNKPRLETFFPPGDSNGKESACNPGDMGLIPGFRGSPREGNSYPLPVFWPGEFHELYSPWGHKELDTTERLSLLVSVQFTQSCPPLCDHMNCSMPGLPIHHQLPEFTQTHVHTVSDAIQPSHFLSSPCPPAPNPSQHQGLFQ